MLKNPVQILKLLCLLLAAVIVIQLARVFSHGTPLKNLTVPALPKLAASANESANSTTAKSDKGTNVAAGSSGTNVMAGSSATNVAAGNSATNDFTAKKDSTGTNTVADTKASGTNTNTNTVAKSESESKGTNSTKAEAEVKSTNGVAKSSSTNTLATSNSVSTATTNKGVATTSKAGTNTLSGTNLGPVTITFGIGPPVGTNGVSATTNAGTNITTASGTNSTNVVSASGPNSASSQKMAARGTGPGGRPDIGKKAPDVPLAIKSRIDRITQSEILAPVVHPMPMALLGIAGDEALLRSPEGQTGLIKEGTNIGSIKLLKIGINRVLIEEKGEKKELMIFSGMGGESLMPKEEKKAAKSEPKKSEEKSKNPNETTNKSA